ncbi:MAG: hypothetical protein ABI112_07860 [Terracoccus sp.]
MSSWPARSEVERLLTMPAEQELVGGGLVGDGAPVVAGGEEVCDEGAALEVDGELVDAADEVGTELDVAFVDDAAVVPPAVVGAGLEHAPIRPATPTRASIAAAVGRRGRLGLRGLRFTA